MKKLSMAKKVFDLGSWYFDKKVPSEKKIANVRVHLKYINLKKVTQLVPKERVLAIDRHFNESYASLKKTNVLLSFQPIGSKKRATGAEGTILFGNIERLAKFSFVESIFINSVKGGKKVKGKEVHKYFCVKMVIAIQIEKEKTGFQEFEERYVLMQARTSVEAYKKIERQKAKYDVKYLNSKGQFVRWKFESLDDYHETEIAAIGTIQDLNGVEVFSLLKKRKLTKERCWDGH